MFVLLCLLIVIFNVRIVLELVGSLAHDVLNPWCQLGILITNGHHEEHAWPQHIVEILCHEVGNQTVFSLTQTFCFSIELCVNHIHVASIHDGLVMSMHQFGLLTLQLIVLIEELKQLVIQGCAANSLLGVVDFDIDVTLFQHEGKHAPVIHEDVGHASRIQCSCELKLPMYHFTGVDVLEIVILQHLEVQHSTIQVGDVG